MPTISEFFGMIIRMYDDEYNPTHFHADYAEHAAMISIESLTVLKGSLPKRAKALLVECALNHREALIDGWLDSLPVLNDEDSQRLYQAAKIGHVSLLPNGSCFIVKTHVLTPQASTRCPRANTFNAPTKSAFSV